MNGILSAYHRFQIEHSSTPKNRNSAFYCAKEIIFSFRISYMIRFFWIELINAV